MDLSASLGVAALICVLAGVPAAWTLFARRWGLIAGSLVLVSIGVAAAWVVTLLWDEGWESSLGRNLILGGIIGLSASVASILLIMALLEVCDRALGPGARLKIMLESLTVASGMFVPLWFVLLRPSKPEYLPAPAAPVLVTVACAFAAILTSLGIVIIIRSRIRRTEVAKPTLGAMMIAVGGAMLAAATSYRVESFLTLGAVLVPLGAFVWLFNALPATAGIHLLKEPAPSPSSGLAMALAPVVAISGSALYGYMYEQGIDVVTAIVGIANGLFLVGRQYLAFVELRGVHERLAVSEQHYRELAHTDPLTGLANRRGLLRSMYQDTVDNVPRMLLILDLDGFKNVNDVRGHDAGDAVLIEVGQRLRLNLRPGDLAARLGGDEFAVLMWGRLADAIKVAERLLGVLQQPYLQPGGSIYISASIGLACCTNENNIHLLLRNADLAQRAAKFHGKNRIELYDESLDHTLHRRSLIEHELRSAIDRQELHLAYQPVVALPAVRPVGAEALLRWTHPELGSVSPLDFIPIAEESGQIEAIGAWVLNQACRQLSLWTAEGHDVWVSVNVSPRELHSLEYVSRVRDVMLAHKVPPQRLVLEITEQAIAVDIEVFRRVLMGLRGLGVRIALDDFGAGYSSIAQLRRMPVDILKIDQGLVTDQDLVDVAARIGQRLGLQVIAEGIDKPAHRKIVEEVGCGYGQGFLFGRGVPAEHLEAMLVSMPPIMESESPNVWTERS